MSTKIDTIRDTDILGLEPDPNSERLRKIDDALKTLLEVRDPDAPSAEMVDLEEQLSKIRRRLADA